MSIEQATLTICGTVISIGLGLAIYFKHYVDAKIDPISKNVDHLVQRLNDHHDRIGRLEERTKNL